MESKYEPLNTARSEFIGRCGEVEFIKRFITWKQLASECEAGSRLTIAAYHWHSLPEEAAAHLANAVMKAIAEMDQPELVGDSVSTQSKRRPPKDLAERIARAHAKAKAALDADGMEVPV